MNRERLTKHWGFIKAFMDGEILEHKTPEGSWELDHDPNFFCYEEYRIQSKLKDKPLELWVNVYQSGYWAYDSKEKASEESVSPNVIRTAIHVKEVK